MARREHRLQKNCAHEGCKEIGRWSYETVRDLVGSYENRNEYRCVRHTRPNEVIGPDNMIRETVIVSYRGAGGNLYWNGNGFASGPGFKAWADDFPEGARLVVTARVELP